MDTNDWILRQRWEAARYSLMLLHPGFGLQQAGMLLGTWDAGMKPGWNRLRRDDRAEHRDVHTFIGVGEGVTTIVPPAASEGPVHDIIRAPLELHGSRLWAVTSEIGEILVGRGALTRSELTRTKAAIEKAAPSVRGEALMTALWRGALGDMRAVVAEAGGRGGAIPTSRFCEPLLDLVERYMRGEICGMVASEVVGVVLCAQCAIPVLGPPGAMPPELRVAVVEHLADVAFDLVGNRDRLDLSGYYGASYLGAHFARAAMRIVSWAGPSGEHSPKEMDRFGKLCLNLDELFAHKISSIFTLHALFGPRDLLGWLAESARQSGRTLEETAELYQLYPPLRAMLGSWESQRDDEVDEALRKASEAAEPFDWQANLRTSAGPIAEESLQRITYDLLCMSLGRSSRAGAAPQ